MESGHEWLADSLGRNGAFLRRLARSLITDRDGAEDLVQEVCLAALEKGPGRIDRPQAWLARVTRNLASKWTRGRRRRERRERQAARPELAHAGTRERLLQDLVDRVAHLDEGARELIILRYFEDLPLAAIATRLAISESAAESRLRRALEALRRRMDDSRQPGDWRRSLALAVGLLPGRGRAPAAAKALLATAAALVGLIVLGLRLAGGEAPSSLTAREPSMAPGAGESPKRHFAGLPAQTAAERSPEAHPAEFVGTDRRGSLVLDLRRPSGDAAAGIAVMLLAIDEDAGQVQDEGLTDGSGRATFGALDPGLYEVSPSIGGQRSIRIETGRETSVEWTLPEGRFVDGQVVDAEEKPVAEAIVHASLGHDPDTFMPVARSDADGRFVVRNLSGSRLRAVHAGSEPSPIWSLDEDEVGPARPRLVLAGRGAAVTGRVVDGDGKPLPGALVQVGQAVESHAEELDASGRVIDRTPFCPRCRADMEGRFRIAGLAPGRTRIFARARGFAAGSEGLLLEAGRSREATIVLGAERVLAGRVTNGTGRALADVRLSVGGYRDIGRSRTRTDAAGNYRLRGLGAGPLRIEVDGDDRGEAEVELTIPADPATSRRDIILREEPALRGRVVDDLDRPLEGFIVVVHVGPSPAGETVFKSGVTGADGAFEVRDCGSGRFVIELFDPRNRDVALLRTQAAAPAEEPLLIRVPGGRPQSFLHGRLLLPSGQPVAKGRVTLWRPEAEIAPTEALEPGTGNFRFGPLAPGPYRLDFEVEGSADWRVDCEVPAAEDRDLGDLRLPEPARIEVLLRFPGADLAASSDLRLIDAIGFSRSLRLEAGVFVSPLLAPGDYRLDLAPFRHLPEKRMVSLAAGERKRIEVDCRPGAVLRIAFAGEAPLPDSFRLRILDASGVEVSSEECTTRSGLGYSYLRVLPPGLYRLEIDGADGSHSSREVPLASSDVEETAVTLRVGAAR